MTADVSPQVDAAVTPGTLLKAERERQELSEREVADRLNMMPGYVAILERNDYQALRSPAFARGYIKAYARLLGLDEEALLRLFDEQRVARGEVARKRVTTRPLQLQHTGIGVVVGLAVLLVLVVALWWWQGGGASDTSVPAPVATPEVVGDTSPTGDA